MKRIYTTVTILSTLALLAGCAPSQQEFASVREAIRGSEKTRKSFLNECIAKVSEREKTIQNAAKLLDTSEKSAPRLFCTRFVEAFRSGRLEYADAAAFKQGKVTPEVVKILQGR